MGTANYQQVIRTYFINLYEGIIYLVVSRLSTSRLLPLFSLKKKKLPEWLWNSQSRTCLTSVRLFCPSLSLFVVYVHKALSRVSSSHYSRSVCSFWPHSLLTLPACIQRKQGALSQMFQFPSPCHCSQWGVSYIILKNSGVDLWRRNNLLSRFLVFKRSAFLEFFSLAI